MRASNNKVTVMADREGPNFAVVPLEGLDQFKLRYRQHKVAV